MLEESEESEDRNCNITTFHDNEFYVAIMDEDLGRIDDMSRKHGSNFLIKIRDGGPIKVMHKGLAILPLHLAASYRRVKSMQSLLSAGVDPEMRDQQGRTALHLVISAWPYILSTWPKPRSKFQTAVSSKQQRAEACLRLLCDHGANVNAEVEGESRQTSLHLTVRYAALPAVQILASYGADVNAVDGTGMTALHMASGILHKDIMASLIRQGADVNKGMKQSGNTPLHLAGSAATMRNTKTSEEDMSCISELLEQGAEPDAVNKAGRTPLQEACSGGNEALVDLLLRYGADINKLTRAGENCLFLFLNHMPNVRHGSLLVKLLSLTSPFTVYNQDGLLPSTLMLTRFCKQRLQLLNLTQQPRRLQDICKIQIYLKRGRGKREELRKILPERLYDFVFNCWQNTHSISFVADDETDSFSNLSDFSAAWHLSVMPN
uniref:ankyrin repeat domain-containing protein 61-like n=1 Tax=Centroberyx gerrardi TaxID=166262 RepID=UPI003AAAF28D